MVVREEKPTINQSNEKPKTLNLRNGNGSDAETSKRVLQKHSLARVSSIKGVSSINKMPKHIRDPIVFSMKLVDTPYVIIIHEKRNEDSLAWGY
jgi:hypothetical protein